MAQDIPEWLAPHILSVEEAVIENQKRTYLVVSRDLEPSLSRFVGYNNGLPFLSEDVPKAYRTPWLAHEIIEFERYRNKDESWQPDHCKRALAEEFKYVAPEDLHKYQVERYAFFCGLVDYLTTNEENTEFIAEVTKSREELEKLVKLQFQHNS